MEAVAYDDSTTDAELAPPLAIDQLVSAMSDEGLVSIKRGSQQMQKPIYENNRYDLDFETSAFDVRALIVSSEPRREPTASAFGDIKLIEAYEPRRALEREVSEKVRASRRAVQAYKDRIGALHADALDNDISINAHSESNFLSFINSLPFLKKGTLFLLENGNLRAVWKSALGDYIGLQFLGGQKTQFVIFKVRERPGKIARIAGHDDFKGVHTLISALELNGLLTA